MSTVLEIYDMNVCQMSRYPDEMSESAGIDDIDRTIVEQLQLDGRMSVPTLAERVGVSRATAYARFDRLIDAGIITGFQATVDHRALGLDVTALLLVSSNQSDWSGLSAQLSSTVGVEWVGLCAGQFDFAVLVRAADLDELRDVVLNEILRVPGVENVQTSVVLDEHRSGS